MGQAHLHHYLPRLAPSKVQSWACCSYSEVRAPARGTSVDVTLGLPVEVTDHPPWRA